MTAPDPTAAEDGLSEAEREALAPWARPDFEAVLSAHRSVFQCDGDYGEMQWVQCSCDSDYFVDTDAGPDEHEAHLAAALTTALADWLADEGTRERVAEELTGLGGEPGSSLHSWRCDYPDRYAPCDCVAVVAREVLAALTATTKEGKP